MRALGRHVLVELYDCSIDAINDVALVREAMLEAARRSHATIVTDVFHTFNPHGISGVVVIAESHLAIHTWPEYACAAVDIFSCGEKMKPELVEPYLKQVFGAQSSTTREVARGLVPEVTPPRPTQAQPAELTL